MAEGEKAMGNHLIKNFIGIPQIYDAYEMLYSIGNIFESKAVPYLGLWVWMINEDDHPRKQQPHRRGWLQTSQMEIQSIGITINL